MRRRIGLTDPRAEQCGSPDQPKPVATKHLMQHEGVRPMSEQDQNTEVVKKRTLVILGASAVLVVGTLFAFTPNASAAPHRFTADLEGSNEVPGPGDPKAIARATVTVDDATNRVCVATLGNIWWPDTTECHIHQGAAGATGGVVVDFMDRPDTCVTAD